MLAEERSRRILRGGGCGLPTGSEAKVVATEPKTVANWVTGELFRLLNAAGAGIEAVKITPDAFAELLGLVSAGQLNLNSAKKVFGVMFETGRPARRSCGNWDWRRSAMRTRWPMPFIRRWRSIPPKSPATASARRSCSAG